MYGQLTNAPAGSLRQGIVLISRHVCPWLLLSFGLGITLLVFISAWLAPDFPYTATFLNKLILLAEGEITQVILGIIFGMLAGFIIENSGDFIFARTGAGGGGTASGHAHHIWLGGSLMLLIFLGLFAPHLSNLIANMTRFKTAIFEFEIKSGTASQRLQFIEKRSGSFGLLALAWAAAMPELIEKDLRYLENVALKIIDSQIAISGRMSPRSPKGGSFVVLKLEQEKNAVLRKTYHLNLARSHIEEFMLPILICGRSVASELVDIELVRNALRAPASDLRMILEAPPGFSTLDALSEAFVDTLKISRDELERFLQDKASCPKYDPNIKLMSSQITDLKKSPYIYLIVAFLNIFTENL